MAENDQHREGVKETVDQFVDYINDQIALLRLKATEKVAKQGSSILSSVILLALGGFFLFFLSISAGLWIGREIGSVLNGFLWVTGFYLLVFLLFLGSKKWILERPFINGFIRKMFDDDD